MVKEGDRAPDFALDGDDGKTHTLEEFKDKLLVLYFYPKDDTPGCTIEANSFTKELAEIEVAGGEVVGISADNYASHCRFRDKYKLRVLLLSDPEMKTIKEYDAYGNKGIFGEGIIRKTFIIKDGTIIKAYPKVQPVGHAIEVLNYLKGLEKE